MINQYTYSKKEILRKQLISIISKVKNKEETLSFGGKFSNWEEAEKCCKGYDSEEIFEKVKNAAMQVKNGKATFERDSYLFYEEHFNYPILACLLDLYIHMNYLKVIDFGGSLGSMYFQHKSVLDSIENLEWDIVEQKHFVDFGKKNLED